VCYVSACKTHGMVTDAATTDHVVQVIRWRRCMNTYNTHATAIGWKPSTWAVISCHHLRPYLDEEVVVRNTTTASRCKQCMKMTRQSWQTTVKIVIIRPSTLAGWLGSRVVSMRDSGTEGPGFKPQPWRSRVTVLGKQWNSSQPS